MVAMRALGLHTVAMAAAGLLFLLSVSPTCSRAENIDDGYVPPPSIEAQPGDPALMTGYSLVEAAKADNAVCLDGSPGLYYHLPGTGTGVDKWYIHLEGGGWCSSVAACQGRSLTNLGSSANYTTTVSMNSGYFSLDPAANPLMYNWNVVYFKYLLRSTIANGPDEPFKHLLVVEARSAETNSSTCSRAKIYNALILTTEQVLRWRLFLWIERILYAVGCWWRAATLAWQAHPQRWNHRHAAKATASASEGGCRLGLQRWRTSNLPSL